MASQTASGVTENRYYIGNIYEEKEKNDTITKINYIFASGKAIAIFETKAPGDSTLLFIHHDQLGSINAYSDVNGILVQELSYDAWGRRRNPETWAYYTDILNAGALDAHGFTGHEHIDLFEVVNMDGRMYDPVIGRFLSPDPIIQAPDYSQSLNRYAYCLNNPLSLVDPSGYSWFSKNWKSLVAAAVGIAVNVIVAGGATGFTISVIAGAAGGAAGAMTGALLNGANLGQVAKATFTGAFWGAVGGAANFASYDDNLFASLFKHAFTESAQETLKGGNMLHGFMMGLVSGISAATINKYRGQIGRVGCIVANAVTCGTVSEIGGGKFANGAVTGAFSIMFNDFMHSIKFKNIDFKAVKDELDKLYEKYGSAEENSSLYRSMGGSIKSEVYDKYYELTGNACALKLSKALRRVGYYIEKGTKGSLTDKHGNAYFVSAEIMQEYLSGIPEAHTMNYNNVIDLRNNLNTGFFFQKGGYTNPNIGHIDVVYNRQFPKRLGNGHKKYVGIY